MDATPSTVGSHAVPQEPKFSWKIWWVWCAVLTGFTGLAFVLDPEANREDFWIV